ncbi:MAG TPA: protein kinase [Polyangiaceae bacterium]
MADQQQRYRVVEKLESGGMAEVFLAESEGLQGFRKQVAIKRVLPHLSEKKKFISMFLDEARLSAQLSHSNCVQVFDIGVGDNAYFIVMEYVDGANLKAVAEMMKKVGQAFPIPVAIYLAIEICKGLAYAHELKDPSTQQPMNIVHRDMSPPNVLLTKYGEVKIVDFGLAKANSQLEKSEPGIIKGKFSYLSPEAAMGQDVDPRTDIFAVGIILWELLAGQRLFLGETDFQTVKKVQQAVVPPISSINRAVTPDLERVIAKALARDPAQRYVTARDLARDLTNLLFKQAQAVSAFDVAQLVIVAMKDRAKKKPLQGSIIDKLIEEALLEFTSLGEEGGQNGASSGKSNADASQATAPLNLGEFVDPKGWLDEMGLELSKPPTGDALMPANITAGNLSALEEDDLAGRKLPMPGTAKFGAPTPAPMQPMARPPTPPGPISAPATSAAAQLRAPEKRGSGAIIGIVVLVLAVAGIGLAYAMHVFPHH